MKKINIAILGFGFMGKVYALASDSVKHFPANGDATLSGVIVDCNKETGLANKVDSYIFGGQLKET